MKYVCKIHVIQNVPTTPILLTLAGVIDTDEMIVELNGEDKKLSTLLKEFNGCSIEMNMLFSFGWKKL